jgi:hypothetical protein
MCSIWADETTRAMTRRIWLICRWPLRFGDTGSRTVIGNVVVEGVDEARIIQLCRG